MLVAMFGDGDGDGDGDGARARGAFRVAPGRFTGEAEVASAAAWMIEAVGILRGAAHAA